MKRTHLRWLVVFALTLAGGCSSSPDSDESVFVSADEVGDDPFTTDVAAPVPVEFVAVADDAVEAADEAEGVLDDDASPTEVRQARLAAATAVAEQSGLSVLTPASAVGVGLYGGSGANACDVDGLIGFLTTNPGQAQAWAGVHGIEVSEIEPYIRSLTPGFLIDNTEVVNHTFSGGVAKPIPSTLEAGTAVLVDGQGRPAVRCRCGNPLLPVAPADEQSLYLYEQNMTVAEGPNTEGDWNNTASIQNVIDAPTASASETHSQTTHVWFTGPQLELLFDFGQEYTVETLHFWNYYEEFWDPDRLQVRFTNASGQLVGQMDISPELGPGEVTTSQDVVVPAGAVAQFATVTLTSANGEIDFQNIGFTVRTG